MSIDTAGCTERNKDTEQLVQTSMLMSMKCSQLSYRVGTSMNKWNISYFKLTNFMC